MAKYLEIGEDTQKIFDEVIMKTALDRMITIKLIHNPALKKEIGKPCKAHAHMKHFMDVDVVIEINEDIFFKLADNQKLMVAEELVTQIRFDTEKETVKIDKGDVQTHLLFLKKHGLDNYEALRLSVEQIKEKLKEEKGQQD
jgi:hypothetical protein